MSKSYNVVTSVGGHTVRYQDTKLGRKPANFSEAKAVADEMREKALAMASNRAHYYVVATETVYVTSTLADVLGDDA